MLPDLPSVSTRSCSQRWSSSERMLSAWASLIAATFGSLRGSGRAWTVSVTVDGADQAEDDLLRLERPAVPRDQVLPAQGAQAGQGGDRGVGGVGPIEGFAELAKQDVVGLVVLAGDLGDGLGARHLQAGAVERRAAQHVGIDAQGVRKVLGITFAPVDNLPSGFSCPAAGRRAPWQYLSELASVAAKRPGFQVPGSCSLDQF